MNIAFDHQIFGWQRYGGISRYFYELATRLSERPGLRVRALSPVSVNEYFSPHSHLLQGIKVPQLPRSGRVYRSLNQWLAPRAMRALGPDVVHETYFSKATVAPPGARTVVTVHDMIHELYPGDFPSWDQTSREKRAAVERADHVICVSHNTKSDLVRLMGTHPDKVTVVYHGYELQVRPVQAYANDRPYVLYVGSRGGYKNFQRLLVAFAGTHQLRAECDLLAFGGGAFSRSERALIDRLGLGLRVRQLSGGDGLLANLYAGAACFVYPSLYEGFGIPPLEAMSCGCPVVCSTGSSIPEVVGSAAVHFDPLSEQSMAQALCSVLFDRSLRDRLRAAGDQRCGEFSWDKCANHTLAVYRNVCGITA